MGRAIFSGRGTCPIKCEEYEGQKKTEDFMQIPLCHLDQLLSEEEAQSLLLI